LWLVRWRDEDGTQKKASYDKKADADRKAAEVGNDLNTGGYIDPTLGKTTFQEFAADWLIHHTFAESSRRATASRLKNHVYPVLGPAPMAKIRPSVIRRWSKGMADSGMATKTQLVIFEQVSSVFIAAVDDGVIRRNPCQNVPRPKPEKRTVEVWEPDTVNTIIGGAPVTEAFAREIGADAYAFDAGGAAARVRALLASR